MLSPFRRFWNAQDELNRLVVEAFRDLPQTSDAATKLAPAVDVVTKGGDMIIRADLPGVKREDVDVSFRNGVLTISGERKEEEEHEVSGYLVKERHYGAFRRSMTLPEGIDEQRIKASFKDGTLEITVVGAGTQVQEGLKRIEIQG